VHDTVDISGINFIGYAQNCSLIYTNKLLNIFGGFFFGEICNFDNFLPSAKHMNISNIKSYFIQN